MAFCSSATPVFVDQEISTQADGAQSSQVPVPLPEDPYEAIRQAYLDGMDTKSEPFEDHVETETPESPLTIAPPTSLPKSTSSTLVPILRRTARMVVRVPPTMLPGLSTSMEEVAAMSESAFCKRFRSSYESSSSSSPQDLPSRKRYRGTSELVEDDEEDEEIKESLDSDSVRKDELSDGGSPRVIVYGYDGLLMLPVAPPSLDYVPGLEEPPTPPAPQDEDEHEPMFIQPHDPDFVPEPIYPEYIPLEDEHVLLAEEQPLPPIVSPTAQLPEYVAESDPEEDPEEYEDDETEDGLVDYPMDGGDGGDEGDDDDGDSSGDDADDEDEKEEEHLVLADSAIVIPTDELVSPPEGIEPIIPPPSTNTATTEARITVRLQAAISFPPEAEVERLLAMPTPSPSPLASLSPPSAGERMARCTAPDASPLPPPLHMPPPVDRRDDIPETEMPPHKRLCLYTLGSKYEVGESSTARPTRGRRIDYGFVNTLDAEARRQGIGEVGVTELAEHHEHDTQDLYALLEDAQDSRTRISQRVVVDSQRVDLLMEDMIAHQETIQIVEDEAYAAREA
uniref:Uncharacterized protein n=1 Tax=Tanacetum cinerariifolium TaxID=118510 RepID=A0A6L2MKM1_TANCI|nr:hypothetical protein [Tanacetum cinerariifolium]